MANPPGTQAEMPFLEHLEELRWRILWSLLALIVGVAVSFTVLLKYDAILLLVRPIQPFLPDGKLITTHPAGAFRIVMSAAFALGFVFASPVVIYQFWAFLSPALYRHEKKVIIPVLIFGALLFIGGVSLAYFALIPLTLKFLLNVQSAAITPMISVTEYFDFAITFSLIMGAVFELPIAVLALTALGIVTPQFLNRYRRHALVICLVASAFITPGQDPVSLAAVALPLIGLYEVSVVCSYVVYRRRQRREAQRAAEDARGAAA
ncbi:MAG: twin-arginine translocase subunit TatC [Gemmatimonadaceae bacterium]|nr:twin-arginine translocase subunit TatC [Gemmatimonadaceae bacterium]